MIQFLAPWAAVGLALLAGPLLIHMLLRRSARHVVFPAARFLVDTRAAAVRLRRPSDLTVLVIRLAVLGAAIAAAAQPIVLSPWRLASWNARVIRAVVIDTSTSVGTNSETARLAEQELTAFRAQRFEGKDLREALTRAAAWLAAAPPGRREVVMLSDFQRGSLGREDLAVLPDGAGIRTIRVGTAPPSRDVRLPQTAGFRGAAWQPSMHVDGAGTTVTWTKFEGPPQLSWLSTSEAEGEREAASRAVHAAMSAGVAAGDDSRRVRVRFAGARPDASDRAAPRTAWVVDAALALRRSPLLRQTNATVQTSEHRGELVVDTNISAASVDAAAVVRAVVLAVRPIEIANREAEVVRLSDAELASWRRDSARVSETSRHPASGTDADSDARWFWALALLLLGAEAWLRRGYERESTQEVRDAA